MLQIVVEVAGTVCDADVQYSLKQLIVSVLQQLIEVWHVRWPEVISVRPIISASTRPTFTKFVGLVELWP